MCEPGAADMTIDRMAHPEQVLVFAWRMLVAGRPHCAALHAEIEAYAGAQAPQFLAGLSAVLMAVGTGSRKPISVGHPGCAIVTHDECILLGLLAAAQSCDEILLAARLRWLVRHEHQRAVLGAIRNFASQAEKAGLRLAEPTTSGSGYAACLDAPRPSDAVAAGHTPRSLA